MNKTIDLPNSEIIVKVAERRRLLALNAMLLQAERKMQFDVFLDEFMLTNNLSPSLREYIKEPMEDLFNYMPSVDMLAANEVRRQQAYAILPENIKTERWTPDPCGCKLNALYAITL